jgi:hypothetical protein
VKDNKAFEALHNMLDFVILRETRTEDRGSHHGMLRMMREKRSRSWLLLLCFLRRGFTALCVFGGRNPCSDEGLSFSFCLGVGGRTLLHWKDR